MPRRRLRHSLPTDARKIPETRGPYVSRRVACQCRGEARRAGRLWARAVRRQVKPRRLGLAAAFGLLVRRLGPARRAAKLSSGCARRSPERGAPARERAAELVQNGLF